MHVLDREVVRSLSAAVAAALALSAIPAHAGDPAALQLPGQGKVTAAVPPTVDLGTPGVMRITVDGNTVIDWGAGSGPEDPVGNINGAGVPGFNIGVDATVEFAGTDNVLNLDRTGNPSRILGHLAGANQTIFVANANGIVVGPDARLEGTMSLLANRLLGDPDDFTADGDFPNLDGAGGDVTIEKGAQADTPLFVSGGNRVNVDVSRLGVGVAVLAGVSHGSDPSAADNPDAAVVITGDQADPSPALIALQAAGSVTTQGVVAVDDLTGSVRVDGGLTNLGTLTLASDGRVGGALVNTGTLAQQGELSAGSITNSGSYEAAGKALTTTAGGIVNRGTMTGLGDIVFAAGGDFVNEGVFDAGSHGLELEGRGNVSNRGIATLDHVWLDAGGDVANYGEMTLADGVGVTNGSIVNAGLLTVGSYVETASDLGNGAGYEPGGQYSITNTGMIVSTGALDIFANSEYVHAYDSAPGNTSGGSVTNTGTLRVGGDLRLGAHDDVYLGGTVEHGTGGTYAPLSATNPFHWFQIAAGGTDGGTFSTQGTATIATDIVARNAITLAGSRVRLMANVATVDADGVPAGDIEITAGPKVAGDYAVRVATGKTVTADKIRIDGDRDGNEPDSIINGTLAARYTIFGWSHSVSDVFTGPDGWLDAVDGTSASRSIEFHFSGALKTVKYNNSSNFRYNGLNVRSAGSKVWITVDPVAYLVNGTSNGKSAVNLLVDGDVWLDAQPSLDILPDTVAVTGVLKVPNTHFVLQSTGDIRSTGTLAWPGYLYLGTIDVNADGSPAPGTLSPEHRITLDADIWNVLPGDVAGASGIHFMTARPLDAPPDTWVVTNANALINFPTALLTEGYAWGFVGNPTFHGGSAQGLVVTYAPLAPEYFFTHPVDASR